MHTPMPSRSIACFLVDMDTTCRHFGSPDPPTREGAKIFGTNFSHLAQRGRRVLHSPECGAQRPRQKQAELQFKVFSFLLFGATDQGAPVRCVTEPATTVNSWRESTLLCKIFGSSLGSNPCRQPTTSSTAGQRASACREKNKRLPMRRSQT